MSPPLGSAGPPPAVAPPGRAATERDAPRPGAGLVVGSALLALTTTAKLAFPDLIGPVTPFLAYFAPVLAAAWIGGDRAGLPVGAAAALLSWLLFLDHSKGWFTPGGLLQAALFGLEAVTISVGTSALQRQRRWARRVQLESLGGFERLQVVLQGVDEGITLQDPTGRLVFANTVAASMCGYPTPEAMLADPPGEEGRLSPIDEDGAPIPIEALPIPRVLRGEPSADALIGLRPGDGAPVRWWEVRASPIFGPGGEIQYAVSVFRDVTEARARAEAVRVSQRWLSTALRSIADAVIATDREGRVIFLNPAAEALTGWSSEEVAGRSLDDVFLVDDEELQARAESPVTQVLREDTVIDAPSHLALVRRDGSRVAIDQSAAPIRDDEGLVTGVVVAFHDVSSRRRAEQRRAFLVQASDLLASSVDYEQTLASVAALAVPAVADFCAVDLLEPEGALRRVSVAHADPSKVALVEDIQRRWPADPTHPGIVERVVRGGESVWMPEVTDEVVEASARDPEHLALLRELRVRAVVAVPLRRQEEILGVMSFAMADSDRRYDDDDVALIHSLADRAAVAIEKARLFAEQVAGRHAVEEARAAAELANRAKDEFLAVLGHELRNPLAPILTALQLMKLRGDQALVQERTLIERQVRHLVRLVDDLLDVSRITRGKIELAREPVEIFEVVAKALETTSPLIEHRQHQVRVEVPRGQWVRGDPIRLAQVFANLLSNAAKYTDPQGTIRIEASEQDGQVVVAVTDTGMGMDPAMIRRVFEPFVQEAQAIDRAQGGLGLGLAIARSMVELHEGTIAASSAGLGHGSTFTVRLPTLPAGEPRVLTDSPAPIRGAARRTRILVVDDNADARATLADALRAAGHVVELAADGPDALERAARFAPEVALLDLGLPVMDGFDLARRLRATPGLEAIKLAAITGYGQPSDRTRTAEAGFDQHLTKPVAVEDLLDVIDRLTA